MAGKILIVDDVAVNRIVLRVKLSAAFYDVIQAADAAEAQRRATLETPDLVLIGCQSDTSAATALCRALKSSEDTSAIPVVMITCDARTPCRLNALEAGADDVLSKPLDDLVLLARLRSLLRARDAEHEWRLRDGTQRALGFAEPTTGFEAPARVAMLTQTGPVGDARIAALMAAQHHEIIHASPRDILGSAGDTRVPDVFVLCLGEVGLGLLSDLRARSSTRHSAVIFVAEPGARDMAARALDLGANDLMTDGFDAEELALRLDKQVARKRMADRLRDTVHDGLRAAVTDPLTGLYNRRYALPHLARIAERAVSKNRPFAVMIADLDHFKRVNDTHGHAAGDAILTEVARRLRDNVRAVDLVARIGGEEFLIALPETTPAEARSTATRLCRIIDRTPFDLPDGGQLQLTVSIGVTLSGADPDLDTPHGLLGRADQALYGSKAQGRNTVTFSKTAA